MGVLDNLIPSKVFYYFEEISKIPRGSGNEKQISDYMVRFAAERGLECVQDKANNILIRKNGTKGYEDAAILIIQGHIDMVCEKETDVEHDFMKEPLNLVIDGDYIKAKGTTLGADNGVAIALSLALLDSEDIQHPPLEVVMTTDEEVGMGGAKVFDGSQLKGRLLLNMDTEEEGKLLVSCCGGMRATITLPIENEEAPILEVPYVINIKGLKGGHSGADIHLQRANANKLMGRTLLALKDNFDVKLAEINGGAMDNAICREAKSIVLVKAEDVKDIEKLIRKCEETFRHEFKNTDKNINIVFEKIDVKVEKVFTKSTTDKIVSVIMLIPYGVLTMSLDMEDLVESSSNIGVIKTEDNKVIFASAVRSCVASRKQVIFEQIRQIALLVGGEVSVNGDYPAWEFNPNSNMLKLFQETYKEKYGEEAKVEAIHAGLECGLFGEKIEGLDMISIGPEMYDVHTPDERLSISSTAKTWDFLQAVLKKIK